MTSIQLIALDLDGTIVNEDRRITERTQAVLHKIHQETSIPVVIATGRMFQSALPYAETLKLSTPLVVYQGAMIRTQAYSPTGRHKTHLPLHHGPAPLTLRHIPINQTVAPKLLELLEAHGCHVNVYVNDVLYMAPTNPYAEQYAQVSGVRAIAHPNLADILEHPPTKFLVINDQPEQFAEMMALLDTEFAEDKIHYTQSRHNFCEIIHEDACKWSALSYLAQEWGIPESAILAIGNEGNDLSMIRHAGVGVAMGNAPQYVKEAANIVAPSVDEDGAAHVLETLIFGNVPLGPASHG